MKSKAKSVHARVRCRKATVRRRAKATVPLTVEDARALGRAKAHGLPSAELLRRGLRIAAAPFYGSGTRPPRTRLFVSSGPRLGEECIERYRGTLKVLEVKER